MEIFKDGTPDVDNLNGGIFSGGAHPLDDRFSDAEKVTIMREYIEEMSHNDGEAPNTIAKYSLGEHEIVALRVTTKLLSMFLAWEQNGGRPSKEVVSVILSAFEDGRDAETVSILVTLSYFAYLQAESKKNGNL